MFTKKNNNSNNAFFMGLALQQAKKVLGNTKDNPAVGCLIVKNNHIISASSTGINGRPHAEVNAIKFSKINLNKATLYTTLEPCSHYGKTPPCVNSIIKNKIGKVIFSLHDPDKRSFKKSFKKLNKHKIIVNKGILKNEIKDFYKSYFKYKEDNLPFVTCKLAVSKDFYTVNKKNKWITNTSSRLRGHLLRSSHDCIVTSSSTIGKDNSRLTCRIDGLENSSPARVILDNKLKIKKNSKIIKESKFFPTIIFYNKADSNKIKLLSKLRVKLIKIPTDVDGNLDLKKTLIKVKKLGFSRVLIETGLKLTVNFLKKKLIDDFKLFISNQKI